MCLKHVDNIGEIETAEFEIVRDWHSYSSPSTEHIYEGQPKFPFGSPYLPPDSLICVELVASENNKKQEGLLKSDLSK